MSQSQMVAELRAVIVSHDRDGLTWIESLERLSSAALARYAETGAAMPGFPSFPLAWLTSSLGLFRRLRPSPCTSPGLCLMVRLEWRRIGHMESPQ